MATPHAVRRWVMTGSITAITATGAIYGAQLKSSQELQKERKRVLEATPEDMIVQLEAARSELVIKKTELERKIAGFSRRRLEGEQENKGAK